jgi:hypothetical protein
MKKVEENIARRVGGGGRATMGDGGRRSGVKTRRKNEDISKKVGITESKNEGLKEEREQGDNSNRRKNKFEYLKPRRRHNSEASKCKRKKRTSIYEVCSEMSET